MVFNTIHSSFCLVYFPVARIRSQQSRLYLGTNGAVGTGHRILDKIFAFWGEGVDISNSPNNPRENQWIGLFITPKNNFWDTAFNWLLFKERVKFRIFWPKHLFIDTVYQKSYGHFKKEHFSMTMHPTGKQTTIFSVFDYSERKQFQ